MFIFRAVGALSALFILFLPLHVLAPPWAMADPGILVVAPDRGFLGNEEVQEAFDVLHREVPGAVLAFSTRDRLEENLDRALATLRSGGASEEIVVLPLFVSTHEALWQQARSYLAQTQFDFTYAEPFGHSYLAEEALFDHARALLPPDHAPTDHHAGHGGRAAAPSSSGEPHPNAHSHGQHDQGRSWPQIVIVAGGAVDSAGEAQIRDALAATLRRTIAKFHFGGGSVSVLYDQSAGPEQYAASLERAAADIRHTAERGPTIVLPFNFASRLTTMMADWTRLRSRLGDVEGAHVGDTDLVAHPNVARWLVRTANAHRPLRRDEVGLILVPHGSDHNWNEDMRAAMAPISANYVTEEAFSMVDPYVVERAVRRLEARDMKAAILLRIFSLESSFRNQAEYVLGLRPDYTGPHAERISSHLIFATTGGMEAHPLLAEAMLDRVRELSRGPEAETVVLVAHGTGGDQQNLHWMQNLERIAAHIRSAEPRFRSVVAHTLREDWPDKREEAIAALRASVSEASADDGVAIVIPVRTIGQGPEAEFIGDLTFRHGTGFAPHPNFVRWLEEMIALGISSLSEGSGSSPETARRQ